MAEAPGTQGDDHPVGALSTGKHPAVALDHRRHAELFHKGDELLWTKALQRRQKPGPRWAQMLDNGCGPAHVGDVTSPAAG